MEKAKSGFYYYMGSFWAAIGIPFFFVYFCFMVLSLGDEGAASLLGNPIFIISCAAIIILWPVFAFIGFKKNKKLDVLDYINLNMIRYVIGFLMLFYGYGKIYHKFFEYTYLTQDSRVIDTGSFELTWYYFGKSNVQEIIVGFMEFVPALMLYFRRTAFVGALIMLPVSGNVLWTNVFNHISGFTFFVSIFVMAANIYIIYSQKAEIRSFLAKIASSTKPQLGPVTARLLQAFKLLTGGTMAYMIVMSLSSMIIASGNKNAAVNHGRNKIQGGFELQEMKINNQSYKPVAVDLKHYKSIYLEPQSRWNTILAFDTVFNPRAMTVKWNKDNDSVQTWLKVANDVTKGELDKSTEFNGIYRLAGNKLYIKGIQYNENIEAVYLKKDLRDPKWFW